MNTNITIEVRRFPVDIRDERTGVVSRDYIVLDKPMLHAAQMVGQSSKELIQRIYNRHGFRVLEIGKAEKRSISVSLDELLDMSGADRTAPSESVVEVSNVEK